MNTHKLIGPFRQLVSMDHLPKKGPIRDEELTIIQKGGLIVNNGIILEVGTFESLYKRCTKNNISVDYQETDLVVLPGLIDAHTHMCFAGSRAADFASRNNGKSYQEIAREGGGIWHTVGHTRKASQTQLADLLLQRLDRQLNMGITTMEVKSGYGLSVPEELKMLNAIRSAGLKHQADVIPTCLAAHIIPKDFTGTEENYLNHLLEVLVPKIKKQKLSNRFDIFVEQGAFRPESALRFLNKLREREFDLTVHGDQFSTGGSKVAIAAKAVSVDHLEASGPAEIECLSKSDVIPVALPGASIGLGCSFAPVRKLLDKGCSLAIASDWNPGSAPQGNLIMQASILSTYEKLSAAEVWAGLTFRAAKALKLPDRGILKKGYLADIVAFPCTDFREILYHQGMLKAKKVWKKGQVAG